MTRAARATKIACDNRKQKSYGVNRPLHVPFTSTLLFFFLLSSSNPVPSMVRSLGQMNSDKTRLFIATEPVRRDSKHKTLGITVCHVIALMVLFLLRLWILSLSYCAILAWRSWILCSLLCLGTLVAEPSWSSQDRVCWQGGEKNYNLLLAAPN